MTPARPLIVVPHHAYREDALRLSTVLNLNAHVIIVGEAVHGMRFSCVIFTDTRRIVETIGVDAFVQLRAQLRWHIVETQGQDAAGFVFEF